MVNYFINVVVNFVFNFVAEVIIKEPSQPNSLSY